MMHPWGMPGQWLKGALHVHTTGSDGKLSPSEVVAAYRDRGYRFVVFTDHRTVTDPESASADGMIVMSGAEIGAGRCQLGGTYHVVALGLTDPLPDDLDTSSAQHTIDFLKSLGAVVMIAHPYWSMLTLDDLCCLDGYDGIEVFNAGCEWETRHGDASQHWDWLIERGRIVLGYAVDDAHWGFSDYDGGWVMVRVAQPSPAAILNALASGAFYSSAGPLIHDLAITGDAVHLACSPVAAVKIIMPSAGRGWTSHQLCKRPPCRGPTTELELPLPPRGQLFRIECVGPSGRKAWTNPIVLE